jgi:uncharacterized protein (TIGR03066 family)
MVRRSSVLRAGAVLFLAAGFAAAADPPPVAPPPREAKPAKPKIDPKLLVGKWAMVGNSYPRLQPGESLTMEFARNGRYRFEYRPVGRPPQEKTGSYIVDGDTLGLQFDVVHEDEERVRKATISSLTPDQLVLLGTGDQTHHRSVLARLPAK